MRIAQIGLVLGLVAVGCSGPQGEQPYVGYDPAPFPPPVGLVRVGTSNTFTCDAPEHTEVGLQRCFDEALNNYDVHVVQLPRGNTYWLKKRVTLWRNAIAPKLTVTTAGMLTDPQSCGNLDDMEAGSVNYDKGCAVLKAHEDYKTFPPTYLEDGVHRSIYDVAYDPFSDSSVQRTWVDEEERTWGLLLIAPDYRGAKGMDLRIGGEPVRDYRFVGRWADGPISSAHRNNQVILPKTAWIQNGVVLDHLIVDGNRNARAAVAYPQLPQTPDQSLGAVVPVPSGSRCYGCGLRYPLPHVRASAGNGTYVPGGWSSVAGARDGANVIFYGVKGPVFQNGALSHALRSAQISYIQTNHLALLRSSVRWGGRLEDADSNLITQITSDSRTKGKRPWISNGFHCLRDCDHALIEGNLFYNNTDPQIGVDGTSARNLIVRNNKLISKSRMATAAINLKGAGTTAVPSDFSGAEVSGNFIDCTGSTRNNAAAPVDQNTRNCAYGIVLGSNGVAHSGHISVTGRVGDTNATFITIRNNQIYGAAVGISSDGARFVRMRLNTNAVDKNVLKFTGDHHNRINPGGVCFDQRTQATQPIAAGHHFVPRVCMFGTTIPYCHCFASGVALPQQNNDTGFCKPVAVRIPAAIPASEMNFDFTFHRPNGAAITSTSSETGETVSYSYDDQAISHCKF